MEMQIHFSPFSSPVHACQHCHFFDGLIFQGSAARCSLPGGARVRSLPEHGCSAFEREPGCDDEVGMDDGSGDRGCANALLLSGYRVPSP